MSARVFKPIQFAEIPKIRSSPTIGGNFLYQGIAKVRRSLFNPDPEETQRFLKEEFAKIANNDRDKWDFDFVAGKPMDIYDRYEWIPVNETPTKNCIRPVKHPMSPINCNNFLYAPIPSSSESTLNEDTMEDIKLATVHNQPKKQRLITDFMQAKKRIEETTYKKKMESGNPPRPTKIARMSLADIAS